MASVRCIGRATWSKPRTPPTPACSGLISEAVQPTAVRRRDLAAVLGRQRSERLLHRPTRFRKGAVSMRIVRGPHARVRAEVRNELRGQLLLLEGGEDLPAEQFTRRDGGRVVQLVPQVAPFE